MQGSFNRARHRSDQGWLAGPADGQVAAVCRDLVRSLHSRRLGPGDKLPPQESLRRTLGAANSTISLAMQALVEAGVLTRRRGLGTVIADADASPRGLWRIGVASFVVPGGGSGAFFADLTQRLIAELDGSACRLRTYTRPMVGSGLPPVFVRFRDAIEDLAEDRIDVVVTPTAADMDVVSAIDPRARVPRVVHVGTDEATTCGVVIDPLEVARQGVALLAGNGCQRIGLVSHNAGPIRGYARAWEGYQRGLSEAGLASSGPMSFACEVGLAGGVRLGARLLALDADRRPDGLIVLDDWHAQGLATVLRDSGRRPPRLVVQTNRQVPLVLALPAVRFEVDSDELAMRAAALALRYARDPQAAPVVEWHQPRLAAGESEYPQHLFTGGSTG